MADERAAQRDDVGQIKVIPLDLAFVHTLKARIETAADVDDDCLRVARQKIPRPAVELSHTQDNSYLSLLGDISQDRRGVGTHLPDQGHGCLVYEEGIGPL